LEEYNDEGQWIRIVEEWLKRIRLQLASAA